jgi:hypothetical protein
MEHQLQQQFRAMWPAATAGVGASQGVEVELTVDEASDPSHGVIGLELTVEVEPFGRTGVPGRLGKKRPSTSAR